MPLTGQAKKDYQREYMRRRRSNGNVVRPIARSNANVRPKVLDPVRPDMQERIRSVRPSDGSELDNLRAARERLEAALGSPAVEAIAPEGCMELETLAAIDAACGEPVRLPERMLTPKPQSYNPMMVGYVPPVG